MLAAMQVSLRLLGMFLVLAAACGDPALPSPIGHYELDRLAMREAVLATMPGATAAEIAEVDRTFERMSMTIDLLPNGKAMVGVKATVGDRPVEQTADGTWSLDGDQLRIGAIRNGTEDVRTAIYDGASFRLDEPAPNGKPVRVTFRRR